MATQKRIDVQMTRKLVVVGDGMTGKTCLLYAFKDDDFDPTHPPTIFDTYLAEVEIDGKTFHLALYDTAGQEIYSRLRTLSYPDTDAVLICFSVDSPSSASNVIDGWSPEMRHYCGGCPVILVACKIDLRTDASTIEKLKEQGLKMVPSEMGRQIAAEIKADAYMECSSKTREGIHDLFIHAARLALNHRPRSQRKRMCCLF